VAPLLYTLVMLTPLALAGLAGVMLAVRGIERRTEQRVRAEHGLPPAAPAARWPLEPEAPRVTAAEPEIRITRLPRRPADPDADDARAILERAEATLEELGRYGRRTSA